MLVVYHLRNKADLDNYKNWKDISEDPEDYDLCIHRERWLEIESSREKGELLFYVADEDEIYSDEFKSKGFNSILKMRIGNRCFIRCAVGQYTRVYIKCYKLGLFPKITLADSFQVNNWHKFVSDHYLGRTIIQMSNIELVHSWKDECERYHNKKIFIKTIDKSYSHYTGIVGPDIYKIGEEFLHWLAGIPCQLLITKYIDIKEDNRGKLEYRSFIINGKIAGISRYIDYKVDYVIPNPVIDFIRAFISDYYFIFPHYYTLDVCETTDGKILVVELNGLPESGRYEGIEPGFLNG